MYAASAEIDINDNFRVLKLPNVESNQNKKSVKLIATVFKYSSFNNAISNY